MTQSTVRIDSNLVEELRTYSLITETPITKCIDTAVEWFLEIHAGSRLHGMLQTAKEKVKKGLPLSKGEKELLSRVTSDGAIHLHNQERIAVAPLPPLSKEAKAEIEAAFKESGKAAKGGKKLV
jgi:hypothetical protein